MINIHFFYYHETPHAKTCTKEHEYLAGHVSFKKQIIFT
jgi:hypothetical protein